LAARLGTGPFPGALICVARPVKPLDPLRLRVAMLRTYPSASIDILDFSRQPVPDGPLEFPRAGLHRSADGALWTGSVTYAANRRLSVWARVRIVESVRRVVANLDLAPGRTVDERSVSAVTRREFPCGEPYAESLADVVGRWPRRAIPAGAALRTDQLTGPKAVLAGDEVAVEVRNGGAVLLLEGKAEAAGAVGEAILVRNPASGRLIRARVVAPGKVALDLARPPGLNSAFGKELQP